MIKKDLIIIVDDDPDICVMIKMVLEYHGYEAIITETEDGLQKLLSSGLPDVILMDMLLSGANGTDICRIVKNDQNTSSIPIMMFSAHPNAKETCLDAGADEFIAKPFEMNDLLAKIEFLVKTKSRQEKTA